MVKENVGAKMDSKIVQAIDRLVEQGEFASRSEFINQAILNKRTSSEGRDGADDAGEAAGASGGRPPGPGEDGQHLPRRLQVPFERSLRIRREILRITLLNFLVPITCRSVSRIGSTMVSLKQSFRA